MLHYEIGSTAKVLAKCMLKYYRISECAGVPAHLVGSSRANAAHIKLETAALVVSGKAGGGGQVDLLFPLQPILAFLLQPVAGFCAGQSVCSHSCAA